jgi:hypothetical protein
LIVGGGGVMPPRFFTRTTQNYMFRIHSLRSGKVRGDIFRQTINTETVMADPIKLTGEFYADYGTQQVTASFKKREFVIITRDNPQYPQYVKMQFVQDKTSLLDSIGKGDEVEVNIDFSGKPAMKDGKEVVYTNINCWKIKVLNKAEPAIDGAAIEGFTTAPATPLPAAADIPTALPTDDDDLLF